MAGLLKPTDLNQISFDAEMEKMDEEKKLKKKRAEKDLELREAFMARDVHPDVIDRINTAISIAAKNGQHQIQVMTFPCTYCSDGGRRINVADPEWPSTLQGFAKKAYDFYVAQLRPAGYKLHAEIISFPGGMPGDAALYLKW